jgi:outer membrane lipoprotein carrier protein
MKQLKYYLSFFLLIFSFNILAATPFEQLDTLLSNFHAMSANFAQKTVVKNGVTKSSAGTMALKRPGKFRWEITQPNHQIVIADGRYLWIYDVDLEQATKRDLSKDSNSPALLLSGSTSALEQRFEIENFQTKGSKKTFQLKPKSDQDMFQKVMIVFDNDQLSQMSVIDSLGQKNIFSFSGVKINPTLSATLFQFHPPKGVDVIQD